MHVSKNKVELVLARQCKSLRDLRNGISPGTLAKVRSGEELRPKTVGRLARLLGCDPADILNDEAREAAKTGNNMSAEMPKENASSST